MDNDRHTPTSHNPPAFLGYLSDPDRRSSTAAAPAPGAPPLPSLPSIHHLHPELPSAAAAHHRMPMLPAHPYAAGYELEPVAGYGPFTSRRVAAPRPADPDFAARRYPDELSDGEGDNPDPPKKKRRRQALSCTGEAASPCWGRATDR